MTQKIFYQILGFILIVLFGFMIHSNTMFINELININKKQNTIIKDLKKGLEQSNQKQDLLVQYIQETSDFPNEKRKAVFDLKIQQDIVLIDLIKSDINTNQKILELINAWDNND